MKEQQRRKRRNKLADYRPYAKQLEFHAAGAIHDERLLMAGNQLGKTYCGAAETAMHLTGRYPHNWPGWRFTAPVRMWAASKTNEVTRDTVQKYLIGEPKEEAEWGTGMIPAECLIKTVRKQGVPDALDGAIVKHASGGTSILGFKSYDQGRQKFQGETLNFCWLDEEPPMDVYMEVITRLNATKGRAMITFTPLLGMSEVVNMFLTEAGITF